MSIAGSFIVGVALATAALTPEEAVRQALQRSGGVAAARFDAASEAAERRLRLDPLELRLGHRAIDGALGEPYTDNDGNAYAPLDDAFVAVGLKPPTPADVAELWVENERAEAAAQDVVVLEREVAAEVRLLHAQVLSLRAEEELAREAVRVAALLEEQTRARASAEVATSLDAHLVALERLDAAGDLEQVSSELRRAEHRLAALVGAPSPLRLERGAELCTVPAQPLDALVAEAEQASPRLKAFQIRRDEFAQQAALSWVGWLPHIDTVLLGWYNEPLDNRDSMRLRVDLALPIFEPFSGQGETATLQTRRYEALLDEGRRELEADVRSALERLDSAVTLVRVLEEGQKSVVDKSVEDAARALEAGQADIARLSDVQGKAVRARRGLLRARYRCEEAAIDLMRVTGRVSPSSGSAQPG